MAEDVGTYEEVNLSDSDLEAPESGKPANEGDEKTPDADPEKGNEGEGDETPDEKVTIGEEEFLVKDIMDDNTVGQQLKASGRTYFFDLEQTREGKTYLRITESRKGKDDKFERNSILVFPEDAGEFAKVVGKTAAKLG